MRACDSDKGTLLQKTCEFCRSVCPVEAADHTSVQDKEISVQIEAKLENNRQLYNLKLHTLWSPLKKDGYIGIIGYIDSAK